MNNLPLPASRVTLTSWYVSMFGSGSSCSLNLATASFITCSVVMFVETGIVREEGDTNIPSRKSGRGSLSFNLYKWEPHSPKKDFALQLRAHLCKHDLNIKNSSASSKNTSKCGIVSLDLQGEEKSAKMPEGANSSDAYFNQLCIDVRASFCTTRFEKHTLRGKSLGLTYLAVWDALRKLWSPPCRCHRLSDPGGLPVAGPPSASTSKRDGGLGFPRHGQLRCHPSLGKKVYIKKFCCQGGVNWSQYGMRQKCFLASIWTGRCAAGKNIFIMILNCKK